MKRNNYETPDFLILPIDFDILTSSDHNAPFGDREDEEKEEHDWGQYY